MKKAFLTANKQQAAPLHEIAFHEEEVWQSSLQLADLGYWDWDFETNTLRYSPAFRILIGGPTRPPLSTFSALLQIVHQDDRAPLTLLLDRTYWGEEERLVSNHGHEFRVVWPDGSIHWLELRGNLFLDTAGRPIQAHGICLNIDSRKQGERIQQSGTEWLRTALDAARNGTWEWNIFTNTITWSDQVEPLFGLPPGTFRGTYEEYLSVIHPEDREHVHLSLTELLTGSRSDLEIEHRSLLPDGSVRWLEGRGRVYRDETGQPYRMSGTVADITDRKMAEIAVREREAAANRFSGLLKQLHKLSIELSRADSFDTLCRMAVERGRSELGFDRLSIWLFNPELTELYGTYGTDEHGTTRDEHGQVWTVTDAWMREFNDYGIPLNIGRSAPLRNEQGEDIGTGWIITAGLQDGKAPIGVLSVDNLIHGEPLHESQIELLGLYGAVVGHLCVRMKAEEALRESQSTARALLNATSDVAFLANADGTLIAFNDAFSKGLGKDPKELTGSYVWNYLPPHVVEKRKPFVYSLIQTGQPMRFEDQLEQGVFDTCIYPIFDVHGKVTRIAIFAHDITQRKQMEMQLLQAQKMESIGRLAGGIAHDFNNLLTAILGYTDLAKEHLPQDEYALGCLEAIHQAGQRAANLTGQLLAFARKQIIEPKIVNLNDLVLNTDKLLRRLIGEDIELVTLPGNDLWHVKIDPGQCEQILVNMAVNARDAMPNGGKLIVETKNVVVNAAAMGETTDMLPGEYVLLAVRDTGVGMEKSVQEHIFEPFFTTKALGKGTGLGLATCHGIVQQNGGYIRLASEPDLGTLFEIYLPRSLQV